MSRKLLVQTKHKFTNYGYLGVTLFIGGPIGIWIGYRWLFVELADRYSGDLSGPYFLMALASIAISVGVPLMLVGRNSLHLAETHDNDEQAFKVWKEWDRPPSANSE